jgi:Tol biopolymer transport system component
MSPRATSLAALLVLAACAEHESATGPQLETAGLSTPLAATPAQLAFTLPPGMPATVTARVQYVGVITAQSSDAAGCASVAPASLPASKPAGSPVYVATFTVTPVGVGSCTITFRDKKGKTVTVFVRVEGAVSTGRIAFISTRDGNPEIYLMGSTGSVRLTNNPARDLDPVRLTTHAAGDIHPAFSPDGSRIVFASYRVDYDAGLSVLVPDLWIMNADGTGQERLTFFDHALGASSPQFSPDGTRIVFALAFHIWIMNADGSDPVQLTTQEDNFSPSFSPDGSRIVYSSDVGSTFSDVWVMNVDGTSPQRLTFTNSGAGTPTFSPDGGHIAFASSRSGNDDIYLIEADGSDEVRLTADPAVDGWPRFGP